jgi:hypothetical protein
MFQFLSLDTYRTQYLFVVFTEFVFGLADRRASYHAAPPVTAQSGVSHRKDLVETCGDYEVASARSSSSRKIFNSDQHALLWFHALALGAE